MQKHYVQLGIKTNINPEIYQELLDSAANAAGKGQSQFFRSRWASFWAVLCRNIDPRCAISNAAQATCFKRA